MRWKWDEWRRWWAWYPVAIPGGHYVWGEFVERRWKWHSEDNKRYWSREYRLALREESDG